MKRNGLFRILTVAVAVWVFFSCVSLSIFAEETDPAEAGPVQGETKANPADNKPAAPVETKKSEHAKKETVRISYSVFGKITAAGAPVGQLLTQPKEDPKKDGYTFLYWYIKDEENNPKCEPFDFKGTIITGPLTLTALFIQEKNAEESEQAVEDINGKAGISPEIQAPGAGVPAEKADEPEEITKPVKEPVSHLVIKQENNTYEADLEPELETSEPVFTAEEDFSVFDIPAGKDTAAEQTVRSVTYHYILPHIMHEGDELTLYGILNGYEGCELEYQWMRSEDEGGTWISVENGTSVNYTFAISKELLKNYWKLCVSVIYDPWVTSDSSIEEPLS